MNPSYRILSDGDEEFLLNRIQVASSNKNEMVSSEWRKYLEVKSMQDISVERLDNLANPIFIKKLFRSQSQTLATLLRSLRSAIKMFPVIFCDRLILH